MQPDQRELVYFTAIETDTLKPKPIPDPGVQLPQAQISSSERIVNGFIENRERLLGDKEVALRIEQIENIFLALGRFHELMEIYRDDWDKRGPDSYVADRYAWGLVRLGQRKQSRDVINQLLVARPTEGRIHFLDGAAYLEDQPPDPKNFPAIVRAWQRTLDFDPDYKGYEGIDAKMLATEIEKFKSLIPPAAKPGEPAEPAEPRPGDTPPEPKPDATGEPAEPEPAAEANAEPPPEVDVEPAPEAETPPASKPDPGADLTLDQQYRLQIAKGQIALGQGNYTEAERAFAHAKMFQPNGFEAEFGRLQAGWGNEAARNKVSSAARELAERKDLTPSQRVDLGVFLWAKMGRNDLAKEQWEAAKTADPALAPRVDKLLGQLDK